MTLVASKLSVLPYNKRLKLLKQKQLKKRKAAVTIGIGFLCSDGVVLCSDTQVTWEKSHKYYEHKIHPHGGENWTAAFTYSGNPTMMKMFNGKFEELISSMKESWDATKLKNLIEGILYGIDTLDSDPTALSLLCGIVIPGKEMRLVHTEGKIVRLVDGMHFIGTGDSSLLQYLVPTLTQHATGFTAWQAIHMGIYLTTQAIRYVEGCGGDIDVLTIKLNGRIQPTEPHNIQQDLLRLEFLMSKAATGLFDPAMPDEDFKDDLKRFVEAVEEQREDIKRRPIFK